VSSRFDVRRLGQGDIVAASSGLVLFLSLFVDWFGVSGNENLCGSARADCTGFQTFTILDILLVLAALAPWILVWIVVRGHELSWPPGEVTMIVGAIATTLILYNGLVDRVGESRSFVSIDIGWWLGLLGALGIIVGGAISQVKRGGVRRRPPGTFA
jgi:hypothetical protein